MNGFYMLIGILKLGPMAEPLREKHGQYSDMFQRLFSRYDFTYRIYDVDEKGELPARPDECDGWILSGSKYGAYEDHAFIPPLEAFIRKVAASGVPMAGICFGHQIIAQALGGKVEKFAGGWAVGAQHYLIDGTPVTLNAWHQDQVTQMPEGFDCVGSNDFCRYAAMVKGNQIFTIQPHPEFDDALIGDMLATRRDGPIPNALIDAAETKLDESKNSSAIADRIAQMFLAAEKRKTA
ncbi:type 1 glutamine amidotransferase [Thioclava sp. GXIMD4216]|uniref:Type 1 glutamine amidotransferase n=1 Tax=Thioclava litoralis TaxID=3076557 RepID=A0ABZ1DUV9_9RHOB|nr:type 1 glutamine amidotransferase [Thioclava sp. FTW29]